MPKNKPSYDDHTSVTCRPLEPVTEEFERELRLLTGGGETDTAVVMMPPMIPDAETK